MIDDARGLLARSTHGTLSTLDPDTGHPYASLVAIAPTPAGEVVLLLSTLAVHTTNLTADPRSSILVRAEPRPDETPLQAPRLSLVGQTRRLDEPGPARELFLEAHPDAAAYVDFADFSFFVMRPERLRFVAGFGRMGWFDGPDWLTPA